MQNRKDACTVNGTAACSAIEAAPAAGFPIQFGWVSSAAQQKERREEKEEGGEGGRGSFYVSLVDHKLRKREDWTVRRIFLSLLIDHMMTKYKTVI
jgi:hypothetical protein